eukprot:scaffold2703_cov129-Isochrysis_galbana.AAC.11
MCSILAESAAGILEGRSKDRPRAGPGTELCLLATPCLFPPPHTPYPHSLIPVFFLPTTPPSPSPRTTSAPYPKGGRTRGSASSTRSSRESSTTRAQSGSLNPNRHHSQRRTGAADKMKRTSGRLAGSGDTKQGAGRRRTLELSG